MPLYEIALEQTVVSLIFLDPYSFVVSPTFSIWQSKVTREMTDVSWQNLITDVKVLFIYSAGTTPASYFTTTCTLECDEIDLGFLNAPEECCVKTTNTITAQHGTW